VPRSRYEFKAYCLRALGSPVIEINVDEDQVDDRVDESLKFYWDYHFDGTEHIYYKHLITDDDIANGYITLPENILGAVEVFPLGDPSISSNDLFNIQYQIALNDLYTLTSVSLLPYYMTMEHLSLIQEVLVGRQPIRFSRHRNRLYIDMDWRKVTTQQYLLISAYEVIDPDIYTDVWGDRWLQNYTTQKIKYQWATNLSKFTGMTLPGGVQFNADRMLTDSETKIKEMEEEMIINYSLPVSDFIG
jgi:hypothetical protein